MFFCWIESKHTASSSKDFAASILCLLDVSGNLVECSPVASGKVRVSTITTSMHIHDRTNKGLPLKLVASLDLRYFGEKELLESALPNRLRDVCPRERRALLA